MNGELADLMLARRLVETRAARGIREAAGLSRGDMARGCDPAVTPHAIYLWERRTRVPQGAKGAAYGRLLRELMTGVAS